MKHQGNISFHLTLLTASLNLTGVWKKAALLFGPWRPVRILRGVRDLLGYFNRNSWSNCKKLGPNTGAAPFPETQLCSPHLPQPTCPRFPDAFVLSGARSTLFPGFALPGIPARVPAGPPRDKDPDVAGLLG